MPETNPDQLAQGWNTIKDILKKYEIGGFKVIRKGYKMSDVPEQRGKDITIYTKYNPEKSWQDWQLILQTITQQLTDQKIPPGYRPPGTIEREEPIKGTNYIMYRYEEEWPKIDFCKKITINVIDQFEPMKWSEKSSIPKMNF